MIKTLLPTPNVDCRFPSEPIEIRLEPGVGALASQSHQAGQVIPVGVELVEGAQLGHHVGGRDPSVSAFASANCR
jgi:hypothetical protein